MSDWKNEDDIKAELRTMTAELRRLREGLRDLVSPPKTNPSRAFLHRQAWPTALDPPPSEPPPAGKVRTEPTEPAPRAEAADRPRSKSPNKKKARRPR